MVLLFPVTFAALDGVAVMTTIPVALLTSVVALAVERADNQHHDAWWLALAVGILVDEATVADRKHSRASCARRDTLKGCTDCHQRDNHSRLLALLSIPGCPRSSFFYDQGYTFPLYSTRTGHWLWRDACIIRALRARWFRYCPSGC